MSLALTFSQMANANFTYDFTASYDSGSHPGYTEGTPLKGFITLASNTDGIYSDDSFFTTPDFGLSSNVVDFFVTDGFTTNTSLSFFGFNSLRISGGQIFNGYLSSDDFYVGSNFSTAYRRDVGFNSATFTLRQAVTPVPEAETYAMFMAGLGLLGFASRLKQKTAV